MRELHVAADGDGDYPTVEAAIAAAGPDDVVVLGAGEFRVCLRVSGRPALRLQGQGPDQTVLVTADGAQPALEVDAVPDGWLRRLCLRGGIPAGQPPEVKGTPPPNRSGRGDDDLPDWARDDARRSDGETPEGRASRAGGDAAAWRARLRGEVTPPPAADDSVRKMVAVPDPFVDAFAESIKSLGHTAEQGAENAAGEAERNAGYGPPVLRLRDSSVEIADCVVELGLQAGLEIGGAGSRPVVRDTTVRYNTLSGFWVRPGAMPTLQRVSCTHNVLAGLEVEGPDCAPTVEECTLAENGHSGLYVALRATPTVRRCVSRSNKYVGITVAYPGTAGVFEDNECRENWYSGVEVHDGATPTFRGNTCVANAVAGIVVLCETTAPRVTQNVCRENETGIIVGHGAIAHLRDNVCDANHMCGIGVAGMVEGAIEGNTCRANRGYGVLLCNGTRVRVRANRCADNGRSGIAVPAEGTAPSLERNRCSGNAEHGIVAWARAVPRLLDNECERNRGSGVVVSGEWTEATLLRNTCRHNREGGIVIEGGARVKMEGNRIGANGKVGVYFARGSQPYPSARALIRNNRFEGQGTIDVQ